MDTPLVFSLGLVLDPIQLKANYPPCRWQRLHYSFGSLSPLFGHQVAKQVN